MNGKDEFRKKIKGYRNPQLIGITVGELISIEPITIKVVYGGKELLKDKFNSVVKMDYLKDEDIGKRYIVQFDSSNTMYVLGELYSYEEYICRGN